MKGLLEQLNGKAMIITCDNWFTGPKGDQFRAAWGSVQIFGDEATLGIKTNNKSSNWYAIIGHGDKQVIIAGCQIHYACLCPEAPYTGKVKETRISESKSEAFEIERECLIYLAQ